MIDRRVDFPCFPSPWSSGAPDDFSVRAPALGDRIMIPAQDVPIVVFLGLALVFEGLERLRPAREVNRWKDLKTDLLSFAFAVAINRLCDWGITGWMQSHLPERLVASMADVRALPSVVKIALALVVADFTIYWIHRAQHRFDVLWRTHAWHHSIEEMYWFAGFRTSFTHSLIYNIPHLSDTCRRDVLTPELQHSIAGKSITKSAAKPILR